MFLTKEKIFRTKFPDDLAESKVYLQMNFWLFPTSDALINTFLRGILVLLVAVYGFKMSWYNGYWLAIIHDTISLLLVKDLV
jgi:hypothetical protein